jgi:UV DNA damage repair endonuclease
MNTTHRRLGFACKWINDPEEVNGMKINAKDRDLNTGATTVRWLREHPQEAEQRLWDLMERNIEACYKLVSRVGTLDEDLRMVRLSSDILPVYTEPSWKWFWRQSDVRAFAEKGFARVGDVARKNNVRLSFHPGQFCVLASINPGIVERSIEEFEYHVDMARWMGYGKTFQDFKINVHISGKLGPQGVRDALSKMTPEARNCLTIENDEMTWGIDSSIELVKDCALVLDIHHHWIKTGEYIEANDDRVKRVIDSWRGIRPVIHYSVSREDCLIDHPRHIRPDLPSLLEQGYKKGKLRAHSGFYWNTAVNSWALTHRSWADIMCESKAKNLASFALYEQDKEVTEPLACVEPLAPLFS